MSWGEYLSNLQRDGLKHAAICGLDGASWLQVTDDSNVSPGLFSRPLYDIILSLLFIEQKPHKGCKVLILHVKDFTCSIGDGSIDREEGQTE
jgi:hypothetical protein